MSLIEFDELLGLYRNAKFGSGGEDDESKVTVATPVIAALLKRVEHDDYAASETGVTLLDDVEKVQVGAVVRVRLGDPRSGFAVLAHDLDGLIKSPLGRMQEPPRYYLVNPAYTPGDAPVPGAIERYRKVLSLVELFGKAASMVDATKSELIFVKEGKIALPIRFSAADVGEFNEVAADRLLEQFADELHHDQKCSILFAALADMCGKHRAESAFRFILRDLSALASTVADGYRLFASSFSYGKIKGELEEARIDYTQKIHKTIVDVQSQLLGIPVATIVVASQMKAPTACGPELLVNFAVLAGAWIFVLLLVIAIINQWMTLNVIEDEIDQQQEALQRDFAKVSADFTAIFSKLKDRVWWHKSGLAVIVAVGVAGGGVAAYTNYRIAGLAPVPCPAPAATASKGEALTAGANAAPPAPVAKPAGEPVVAGAGAANGKQPAAGKQPGVGKTN